MNQPQPRHHQQLSRFADNQLSELSTRDICASTVHLILAVAFFTGAAIGIAKQLRQPKKIYLASLHDLLQTRFGLEADNAEGMVESNARLYKRYILIEKIYNIGLQAALAEHLPASNDALKNLLTEYADLSMSGLNIEGIKEPKAAPAEVESLAAVAPIVTAHTPPASHRSRTFLLLLLIVLVATGVFFLIYSDALAATFPALQPTIATFMDSLMKDIVEPTRQWLEQYFSALREE